LKPTRTIQPKLKIPISALLSLQETLSRSDLHKHLLQERIKEGKHLKEDARTKNQ